MDNLNPGFLAADGAPGLPRALTGRQQAVQLLAYPNRLAYRAVVADGPLRCA